MWHSYPHDGSRHIRRGKGIVINMFFKRMCNLVLMLTKVVCQSSHTYASHLVAALWQMLPVYIDASPADCTTCTCFIAQPESDSLKQVWRECYSPAHVPTILIVSWPSVQLWVERITQTWVHCSKFTGRSIRARNLADSFVHIQQHLLQENAALRQSIEELTKQQTSRQLDLPER